MFQLRVKATTATFSVATLWVLYENHNIKLLIKSIAIATRFHNTEQKLTKKVSVRMS